MIPRSYSRDLALQLNFIYDAARRSPERFEGNHRRQPRRPHSPSGFIWICRLEGSILNVVHIGFFHIRMSSSSLWQRFQQYFLHYRDLGFSLDISRMKFPDDFFEKMQPNIDKAFEAMRALEAGAIANPSEKRMVGHYWLRNTALAPTPEIRTEIEQTIKRIKTFAADIHSGKIAAENGKPLSTCCSLALAARRSDRNSSQTLSDHVVIQWTSFFSITQIQTASTASSRR